MKWQKLFKSDVDLKSYDVQKSLHFAYCTTVHKAFGKFLIPMLTPRWTQRRLMWILQDISQLPLKTFKSSLNIQKIYERFLQRNEIYEKFRIIKMNLSMTPSNLHKSVE